MNRKPLSPLGQELIDMARAMSAVQRASRDPRDPDHSRPSPFDYHNCAGCDSGRKPCRFGHANPRDCDWLHARND